MKQLAVICLAVTLFALGMGAAWAQEDDPRAVEIVEEYREKTTFPEYDVTLRFTLVQQREGQSDRVTRLRIYRRDAEDAFTIVFLYPESEEGRGYLQQGDDLFLYLPSTREFVYRSRREDVGSADVRTNFFGGQNILERYSVTYDGEATVNEWPTDVVRLDSEELDVAFPIQRWHFRRSDGLPVKVENYSASETLLRTYYIVSYQELPQNNAIFTRLVAVNHQKEGRQTLISIENVSTEELDDYIFTRAFLEEQAR